MVYFRARNRNIGGLDEVDIPTMRHAMRNGHLVIPIIALFVLLVKGYSPIYAGFVTILMTVGVSWLRKETRMGWRKIVQALMEGGQNAILVAIACAGTGIIVSVVTHTGLGLAFSNILVSLSGGNLVLSMFLVVLAAIVIGSGAPTTATYILVSTVCAGALVKLGADIVAAHLFCLYFAVIAGITPPVAIAAYAGAALSKGDPMKTGVEAFKIAIAGFIVPFIFVLNPAIVLRGPVTQTILGTVTALLGIIALAGAIQGWLGGNIPTIKRMALFVAGFCLLLPGMATNVAGASILGFVFLHTKRKTKNQDILPVEVD